MKFFKKLLFLVILITGNTGVLIARVKVTVKICPFSQKASSPLVINHEKDNFEVRKDYNNDDQLPLVVIICSYNNALWVIKNLDSVFMQKYQNFRVIYVDDASGDGTADIVQAYIDEHNLQDKIILIRNEVRYRKLKNEYLAFHLCEDNEIIVQLDGDDWFAHDRVFSNLNHEYLTNNIWITYGSHKNFPPSNIGTKSSRIPLYITMKRYFRHDFRYMPTRSFYAWLVKLIKLEDFINDDIPGFVGKFYPTSDDVLLMWAMLEMAHYRFKYLKDVSYIANRGNPIITIKIERHLLRKCGKSLTKKIPLYSVVRNPIIGRLKQYDKAKADVILLSDNYVYLDETLIALENSLENLEKILVIYQAEDKESQQVYKELREKYPDILFVDLERENIRSYLHHLKNTHVLLFKDTIRLAVQIDCRECIKQLERTFAYAVYLSLNEKDFQNNKIPYQRIFDDLCAWKFSCDTNKSLKTQTFNGALYRKSDIIRILLRDYKSIQEIVNAWQLVFVNRKKVGLFYQNSKTVLFQEFCKECEKSVPD